MIEGWVLTYHLYGEEGKLLRFLFLPHKITKLVHLEFGFRSCIAQQGTILEEGNMTKSICAIN
jgi:hypothetical protein